MPDTNTTPPPAVTDRQRDVLVYLADKTAPLTARAVADALGYTSTLRQANIRSALTTLEAQDMVTGDTPVTNTALLTAGSQPPVPRYRITTLGILAATTAVADTRAPAPVFDAFPRPEAGNYTTVTTADEVTDEMLTEAVRLADSFYPGRRIDWDDLADRLDGMDLTDGSTLDLVGGDAIEFIRRHVTAARRSD